MIRGVHDQRFALSAAGLTHPGAIRPQNEDALLCGKVHAAADLSMERAAGFSCGAGQSWLLAVADGIGGNQAGERASREVVSLLSERQDYSPTVVRSILYYAHTRLFKLGATDPSKSGLGTTIAGIGCGKEGLFTFSVGDSRAYRFHDGYLTQLTKDDSVAEAFAANGDVVPLGLGRHTLRALTQCIGGRFQDRSINPHVDPLEWRTSMRVLICTDGLYESISHDRMEELMRQGGKPADVAERLLAAAIQGRARDNVTLAVADLEPG